MEEQKTGRKGLKKRIFRVFIPLIASFLLLILSLFDFPTIKLLGKDVVFRFATIVIFSGILLIFAFYFLEHFFGIKIAAVIVCVIAFLPLIIQNIPINNIRHTLSAIVQMSGAAEPIIIKDDTTRLVARFYLSAENPIFDDETKIPEESKKFWVVGGDENYDIEKSVNFLSDNHYVAVELEKTEVK